MLVAGREGTALARSPRVPWHASGEPPHPPVQSRRSRFFKWRAATARHLFRAVS